MTTGGASGGLDRGSRLVPGALLAGALALTLAVAADAAGVPYLRAAVAVVVLSTAGGLGLAALTGQRFDRAETVVYTVAASVVSLMLFGVVLNTVLMGPVGDTLGVQPFVPVTLIVAGVLALVVAAVLLVRGGYRTPRPAFGLRDLLSPAPLLLLHLPVIAVVGALVDRWYDVPELRLVSIGLVALLPLGLLAFRVAERYAPLAVYCGAVAMFYQTTLSAEYFSGGDGGIEYYFANRVIVEGAWMPTFTGTKTSLLSLVVVHPIYTLVGGLDLLTTMKVVYPLVFAFAPVAVYLAQRRLFGHPTALLSAFLVTFLHPYFRLLTQNSRSGMALLFVACFALLAVDRVRGPAFTAYATLFLFGIVASHYGVIAMFLVLVALAYAAGLLDDRLAWSDFPTERLRYPTVLFLVVVFFAWYIYTASTVNFDRLVSVAVNDVALGLGDMFSTESNATQAVSTGFDSLTYRLIRMEYIVVTLLGGFGFLHVSLAAPLFDRLDRSSWVARLRDIDVPTHPVFHMFTAGANVLLLLAFAPVDLIGVARIYALAALFIVPYAVFEARWLVDAVGGLLPVRIPSASVVAVGVAALLVINSGLLAATVTHDRSPQPELEHERIETSGTDREVYHLYRHYSPPEDVAASAWLFRHSPGFERMDRQLYLAGRHGGFTQRFFTTADWAYHADPHRFEPADFEGARNSYFVQSAYMTTSGYAILNQPSDGSFSYMELTPLSELGLEDQHVIYANDKTVVYWSGNTTDDDTTDERRVERNGTTAAPASDAANGTTPE